ncbi:phage gp6-like head-tail connector protein [Streptomyces virginiae]
MAISLATLEDVADRLDRPLTDDERTRVSSFLLDVSALIVDHCGRDFRLHDDDLVRLDAVAGPELRLPRSMLPLASIHEVRWSDGSLIDDWSFSSRSLWRARGWRPPAGSRFLGIAMRASYGYEAVPSTVIAVACAEVLRWMTVQPGVTNERMGDLEVSYGATAPTQSLSAAAEHALRRYRPRITSTNARGS